MGANILGMPAIHVRDVPPAVLAALKARAARNRRSMQRELLDIISTAVAQPSSEGLAPIELRTTRAGGGGDWRRAEFYADDR